MDIIIRKASVDDATSIALLGRITFDETFGHLFKDRQDLKDYFIDTFSVEKLKYSLQKENNTFWIATINNLPVGYAKLKKDSASEFLKENNVGQLQKIYVLKDFLSLKIGYQLQNTLLLEAQLLGLQHIWLSVLHSNEKAISFYAKNQFVKIGSHNFSIGKENFHFIAMAKKMIA